MIDLKVTLYEILKKLENGGGGGSTEDFYVLVNDNDTYKIYDKNQQEVALEDFLQNCIDVIRNQTESTICLVYDPDDRLIKTNCFYKLDKYVNQGSGPVLKFVSSDKQLQLYFSTAPRLPSGDGGYTFDMNISSLDPASATFELNGEPANFLDIGSMLYNFYNSDDFYNSPRTTFNLSNQASGSYVFCDFQLNKDTNQASFKFYSESNDNFMIWDIDESGEAPTIATITFEDNTGDEHINDVQVNEGLSLNSTELDNFFDGNMRTIYIINLDGNLFTYSYYVDNDNWTWENIYNDKDTRSPDFENMVTAGGDWYYFNDMCTQSMEYFPVNKTTKVIPESIYHTSIQTL